MQHLVLFNSISINVVNESVDKRVSMKRVLNSYVLNVYELNSTFIFVDVTYESIKIVWW